MLTDSQRAALTARLRRGRVSAVNEIPRRPAELADLPVSFGQEQLWFLDRFAPGLAAYNIPLALGLAGPLDVAALGRSLDALVARHEALRTRLAPDDSGHPVQVISAPAPVPLERVDLSGLDQEKRPIRLREFIDIEAVQPFSLAQGPLLRAHLLRLDEQDHVLLVVVHHAVFDGWSAGVFVRELTALYGQEAAGEPAGLAELPVQFADYALWERDRLQTAALAELEDYWSQALDGFETLQFPADLPRPAVDTFDGGLVQLMTDRELLGQLRELSRQEGTTLFVTLLAALLALLHRYTGQTDLVVGTVSANRGRRDLAPMIGFLVNTLPIRCGVEGDPSFRELMARVREVTTGAYSHQDLPFGKLVETLRVERDASRAPVFQIAMTYAERDTTPARAAGVDFVLTDLAVGIHAAKFDLGFLAEARADGLWLECSYKTGLFHASTVARLLEHLAVLLRGAVAGPSGRLSDLPVLTDAELHRELSEWNDTAAQLPVTCVHQAFEAQVRRHPDAVAAEFEGTCWSYAELNAHANRIARRISAAGGGPEVLVGVCLPAGLRRLATLLAVWKAGGAYVPLDPRLPAERLGFMMTDAAMPIVVTDEASAASLPGGRPVTVLTLDREWAAISALDACDLSGTGVAPAHAAYVIYTSGSTGQPKGVVVEHRHAANLLQGMAEQWRMDDSQAVLSFAAFTFDVSVMDMFMPLLGGARVVMAPAQTLHSPQRLAALIRDTGVTFACLPPAVLNLLVGEEFPSLRTMMAAGEELPSEVARRWLRPGLRLVNGYGPTEATVIATYQELDVGMVPPPIGLPTWPNYQAYVLDAHLHPVPAGVLGELYLGGASVARGYLNRPELTRERFIPDPFRPGPGARLYRTGDLVRRRTDGAIVFVGRTDDQVKIRGLRVELGEIEAALATCPGVAQAVVAVTAGPDGDKQLTGYVRIHPGTEAAASDLQQHLASALPPYMVPGCLMFVEAFPLNPSGKIDKAALPAPQAQQVADHIPPSTLLETMVTSLFGALLGQDQVGVTDSLFDLGGNSLTAMRLVRMLDDELDVDIDVASVFVAPAPRLLAALLRDKHGFADSGIGELEGVTDDVA
ncbi:MAG TPA: amino acid adenylation domain-containing protein [Streptosporangiaceae bacterium]|jgi:amino acid adenylation domain-containing protein